MKGNQQEIIEKWRHSVGKVGEGWTKEGIGVKVLSLPGDAPALTEKSPYNPKHGRG